MAITKMTGAGGGRRGWRVKDFPCPRYHGWHSKRHRSTLPRSTYTVLFKTGLWMSAVCRRPLLGTHHTTYSRYDQLLHLLRSPARSLGFTIWGEIFANVTVLGFFLFFFNPTIEVVTFHLRGWCMLGAFLLPAFTRLGHDCQDIWRPCDGMHVRTGWTLGLYSHPKEFWRRIEPTTLHQVSPTHDQRAIPAQGMNNKF